uniref:Uncharacterized protein n=1 Tax=Plectus sambesii TaxID=2011161 RepID=A0A914VTL9_9BILA
MADDRIRRIEAEMAKFENEINQPMARPPMPNVPSGMALRFMPHAMQVRGPSMPPMGMMRPPMGMMPPRPPPNMGMMGGFMPPPMRMPPFMGGGPGPSSSSSASSSTIEAGPTRYLAPGAIGVKSDKQNDEPAPQPGPSKMLTQVLPSDVELLAAKRQQEVAYQNSYIGQVLRGEKKMKRFLRVGGGQYWEDPSLAE